jgi:hypothetical protein
MLCLHIEYIKNMSATAHDRLIKFSELCIFKFCSITVSMFKQQIFNTEQIGVAEFQVLKGCSPGDGGSKHLRNVGKLLPYYTVL